MKENSSEFLNALLTGYKPTKPSRAALRKSRREFKGRVRQKVKADRAEYARLRRSARTAFPAKKKLEALFHEVYGRENPVSKKRKSKKKRKNPMPSGLKAYWAKKRRKRTVRKATRSSRRLFPAKYDKRLAEVIASMKSNPRRRKRRRKVVRKPRRIARARRRSNPVRKARRITLKGFTASQIRTVASVVRRATGKRVRVVKP
jgi:hypothetical protein